MSKIFKGRSIAKGLAEGEALVSKKAISFMAGVDVGTGVISEVGHPLHNVKLAGKILVLPSLSGSAAATWSILRLVENGLAPKAIIIPKADAILIAGTVMGKIPAIDSLEFNPVEKFKTGDKLRVDGDKGTVELLSV